MKKSKEEEAGRRIRKVQEDGTKTTVRKSYNERRAEIIMR